MKQKKRGKICFVIDIAEERIFILFIYDVIMKHFFLNAPLTTKFTCVSLGRACIVCDMYMETVLDIRTHLPGNRMEGVPPLRDVLKSQIRTKNASSSQKEKYR